MQRTRIAGPSEPPSRIPCFSWEVGCTVYMQRTRIPDPSEPPSHIPGVSWEVGQQFLFVAYAPWNPTSHAKPGI
jgi:hypothetical protein